MEYQKAIRILAILCLVILLAITVGVVLNPSAPNINVMPANLQMAMTTETPGTTEILASIAETFQAQAPSSETKIPLFVNETIESNYGVFPPIEIIDGEYKYLAISNNEVLLLRFHDRSYDRTIYAIDALYGNIDVEFPFGLSCPLWIGNQRLLPDETYNAKQCIRTEAPALTAP